MRKAEEVEIAETPVKKGRVDMEEVHQQTEEKHGAMKADSQPLEKTGWPPKGRKDADMEIPVGSLTAKFDEVVEKMNNVSNSSEDSGGSSEDDSAEEMDDKMRTFF